MNILKEKGYVLNKKVKLDRFKFYNDENHKDLTVKVKIKPYYKRYCSS